MVVVHFVDAAAYGQAVDVIEPLHVLVLELDLSLIRPDFRRRSYALNRGTSELWIQLF